MMHSATKPQCGLCLYWDEIYNPDLHPEIKQGECGMCRHHAPTIILPIPELDTDARVSTPRPAVWPMTRGADWCGDFWPRNEGYAYEGRMMARPEEKSEPDSDIPF